MATIKIQNEKVITKNGLVSCSCCEFPITYGPFLNWVGIYQTCFKDGAGHLPSDFNDLPDQEKCHPQRYRVKTTVNTYVWGSVGTEVSTYSPCNNIPTVEFNCDTSGNLEGYEEFDCFSFSGPLAPPPEQTITLTDGYSPSETGCCYPEELTEYPEFDTCNQNPQPLEEGQLGGGSDGIARNIPLFEGANNVGQFYAFKWRIEHGPIPTGYLKVWIVIRTQTVAPDENHVYVYPTQCGAPLITGPAEEEIETYEWTGTDKLLDLNDLCQKIIYSEEGVLEADVGEIKTVGILKYSFTQGYEPNDPDEFGNQGDKPNGIEPQE